MTLRITLEIVPFGNEDAKRTIHTINVSNMGKYSASEHTDGYLYSVKLDGELIMENLYHSRSHGALKLAEMACVRAGQELQARDLAKLNQELKLD